MAVVAARIAPAVVQTMVSAPDSPRTDIPEVPAVSTHLAVAATLVPVSVLALVESTALKYLDGSAMVTFPPIGTAVTVVKPKVTVPVLTVPGTASVAVVKARLTPVPSWPPRATVFAGVANWRSMMI